MLQTNSGKRHQPADGWKDAEGDYERIQSVIRYLRESWADQPGLEDIAAHAGLSPFHFQKLFRRWAGISPKEFVQALTIDHARKMLKDSANILDTALDAGLSGPSRLHDLFVDFEAMTPGEFKRGGEGLDIAWGFHASPFGRALVMVTDRGVCGLGFCDDDAGDAGDGGREKTVEDMMSRWPRARYREAPERTQPHADRIFRPQAWRADEPLKVFLIGTDFEIRVWEKLLRVPMGSAVTYSDIAVQVCSARAARAVGSAVGRNPVAFVVPCHRVIRKDGSLGGYHWGITRKQAIIGWEAGKLAGG